MVCGETPLGEGQNFGLPVSALLASQGQDGEIGGYPISDFLREVTQPTIDVHEPFLMPVEGVFSVAGRGTIVSGRID